MEFEIGNKIKVIQGNYIGKEGRVDAIAPDVPKSIGVILQGAEKVMMTYWFKPEEVELVEE